MSIEHYYGYWCARCREDVRIVRGFPQCECTESPSPWVPYKTDPAKPVRSLIDVLYDWWFTKVNPGAKS